MVCWYLCQYDSEVIDGEAQRRCAMRRHIPFIPNAQGATWEEAETLGNQTLVRVEASAAMQDRIAADPDMIELVRDGRITVRLKALSDRLTALGLTSAEKVTIGTDPQRALAFLLSLKSEITHTPDKTGFVIGSRLVRSLG